MTDFTDKELLRLFALEKSDDAFRELVTRNVNLVHGSAARQMRDWSAAQDITQAVFIVLWNKAHTIRDAAALPAWLLTVTRLACRDALKRQAIRTKHEQGASMNAANMPIDFNALAANLDEAMEALSPADRSAVALRYLAGRSYQDVAAAMGISEDAAKKRVRRALERLRNCLAKRGLNSPADLLEKHLAELSLFPASAGMVEAIHAACRGAGAAKSLLAAKAAEALMTTTKIKAAVLTIGALALTLTAAVVVSFRVIGGSSGKSLSAEEFGLYRPPVHNATISGISLPPDNSRQQRARQRFPEVYLSGRVRSNGAYSLVAYHMNLLQLIFAAGGVDPQVPTEKCLVTLIRPSLTTSVKDQYALKDLLAGDPDPPLLQGEEVIQVSEAASAAVTVLAAPPLRIHPPSPFVFASEPFVTYIGGKVKRAGPYLQHARVDILQLITSAGGSDDLNPDTAIITLIRRTGPHSQSSSTYSMKDLVANHPDDPALQTGDIVTVTQP